MEVNGKTKPANRQPKSPHGMIRDYWPRYWRRALTICIGMEIIVTFAICGALVASNVLKPDLLLMIIAIAVFSASAGINILLIWVLLSPLQSLAAALTHVAGEPTTSRPPNPNSSRFSTDGFGLLLQKIYEISVQHSNGGSGAKDVNSPIIKALSETKTGFVILDSNRQIIYANKSAPTRINTDSKQELELMFDESDSLSKWLDERDKADVHAERRWRRVPNKTVDKEDRRVFDIAASYERGSEAETVLVFYDHTDTYKPEDDSLDFIAFAAHELRGPITVIRGYLDVLSDELSEKLDSEERELFQRLVVSSNRLSSYISNILNSSRYDRRHLKVHLAEVRLSDVYATVSDDLAERARAQGRSLRVNLPSDLPTIAADRGSLSEVISNLVDNAIKYSNEGGIVDVSAKSDGHKVIVSVTDHGIGMPASVIDNLFHKFYRSHRSRETVAGTGIGLYISKAIVESHGGKINVRSVEGQGSTFEFTVHTYAAVADKLKGDGSDNKNLISEGENWIKNHSMFSG